MPGSFEKIDAGLAIPRTKVEDEWIGGARDDAMDKAQKFAHKAFGKAGEAFVVEFLDGGQVGGDDVQELSGSPKSRCAGCCGRLTSRQKERELSERKRVE